MISLAFLLLIGCSSPENATLCAAEEIKAANNISVGPFGKSMNKARAEAFIRKTDGDQASAMAQAETLAKDSDPYKPLIEKAICEDMFEESDRQFVTEEMIDSASESN